ncbi:MotA/TolQ/ExbB proton channel family protein [Sansalvadorimonas sp. 2012CJ34-2]|uniref:MotA/TolQ/ExbB proton channel family protein n=1 Tax=Parendozoicomonas callyspongiae TaxID=2942213 RepID=A0ABT0PCP0_9GAMM|nr:MotA/TolQ/ExbB proton channel family protein [Sansalvadorimonas sp. 2012CJ34-2]MCL6269114.1 MotA/TolQ/ExbB proton channel family protein [Sansalvadorimonas sp. 2012CJ34-2]
MKHKLILLTSAVLIASISFTGKAETIDQQILRLEAENQSLRDSKLNNDRLLKQLTEQQQAEFKNSDEFINQLKSEFQLIHKKASTLPVTQLAPGRLQLFSEISQIPYLPSPELLSQAMEQVHSLIKDTAVRDTIPSSVVQPGGSEIIQPVTYAGPFAAISKGNFLIYQPELDRLVAAPHQPNIIARLQAEDFVERGHLTLPIDPGHGALLTALSRRPSLWSKIESSGLSGWLILLFGGGGIILTGVRLSYLQKERLRIRVQKSNLNKLSENNSLGRILNSLNRVESLSPVTSIQVKLTIHSEKVNLKRGHSTVQLLVILNPLIGALATATGMIKTLQTVSLGSGEEQMMAAGAAQELMPLMLGLATALPLLLCYFHLTSRIARLSNKLEKIVSVTFSTSRERRSSYHYKDPVIIGSINS